MGYIPSELSADETRNLYGQGELSADEEKRKIGRKKLILIMIIMLLTK